MPRIDVLPSSSSVPKPGYALVADTRNVSGATPATSRKRAVRTSAFAGGDATVRQQNAVLKHLAELDKDSHRDVHIPVPSRQKDIGGRAGKKTTTNVRRILASQKTFANHLADEEAARAQQTTSSQPAQASTARRTSTAPQDEIPESPSHQSTNEDPLLKSYVPEAPSPALMEALVSAPPLSYGAARATVPDNPKPQRHFCEICGYWGMIKCLKCGARVCGLDCRQAHDDGRCLKFYA